MIARMVLVIMIEKFVQDSIQMNINSSALTITSFSVSLLSEWPSNAVILQTESKLLCNHLIYKVLCAIFLFGQMTHIIHISTVQTSAFLADEGHYAYCQSNSITFCNYIFMSLLL